MIIGFFEKWDYEGIIPKGEKQKMGSRTEDKEIEYTTKKGNVLTFSYKAECFSGSGAYDVLSFN